MTPFERSKRSSVGVSEATASVEGASVIVASSKEANVDRALAELPAGAEGHVLDIIQESAVRDFFSTIGAFPLGQRLRQLGQKSAFSNFFTVSLATANL